MGSCSLLLSCAAQHIRNAPRLHRRRQARARPRGHQPLSSILQHI